MDELQSNVGTVVVGSGAAALAAAIAASDEGSEVVVFEASDLIGGTTSISAGQPWIPLNEHMKEDGIDDSRDEVLTYLDAVVGDRALDRKRLETYVDNAAPVISQLEATTPLRFTVCRTFSDYHADKPGGKTYGRSLDVVPYEAREALGEWDDLVRRGVQIPLLTIDESSGALKSRDFANLKTITADSGELSAELIERMKRRDAEGIRTCGGALIAALLRGVLDREIPVHTATPVKRLTFDGSRVSGVVVESDREETSIEADGVVLGAGGFEWNEDMVRTFLGVPRVWPLSPPCNRGDGLRLGLEAGAELANMTVAWACPATSTGEEEYEGEPLHSQNTPRQEPGVIAVNRHGERFGNEAVGYMHFGKYHRIYDPVAEEWPNQAPVWMVFDQAVRDRIALKDLVAGEPVPEWVEEADSIAELASRIGVPTRSLVETVERWNGMVEAKEDSDFGRGSVWFEGWPKGGSDPERMLASISSPPYYALRLYDGVLGTAGGLLTDERGRVRSMSGGHVEGLYAAGNTAASVWGPAYPAGGATIGQGLVFGYLAGKDIAREHARRVRGVATS